MADLFPIQAPAVSRPSPILPPLHQTTIIADPTIPPITAAYAFGAGVIIAAGLLRLTVLVVNTPRPVMWYWLTALFPALAKAASWTFSREIIAVDKASANWVILGCEGTLIAPHEEER